MEIACQDVIRAVSDFLDGEVDPTLGARMRAHFAHCRHCVAILDGARNLIRLIGDGRSFEIPEGYADHVFQKIKSGGERS